MKQRRHKLALGTAQLGQAYGIANIRGKPAEREVDKLLAHAREVGIDLLDTAVAYGDAEERLGRAGIADFRVVTKLPGLPADGVATSEWVCEQIEASLRRLRVGRLYGVLLHKPSDLLRPDGPDLARALESLKRAGMVNKIGVSIYAPSELDSVLDRMPVDIVQAPLNVIDRRIENSGWGYRLAQAGVELHARSIFLQGVLLMPQAALPAHFMSWRGLFERWYEWLEAERLDGLSACVAHALAYHSITQAVVGCETLAQLSQIVRAAQAGSRMAPEFLESGDEKLINPSRWERS